MDQFGIFPVPVADITTSNAHFGHVMVDGPNVRRSSEYRKVAFVLYAMGRLIYCTAPQ